jgi:hypothetical protein
MAVVLMKMGGRPPLSLDAGGKDVECALLERARARLVFCLNWEKQAVPVNLGLSLPAGSYAASVITLDHESPARIGGKATLAAPELERFRLGLAPGEARSYRSPRSGRRQIDELNCHARQPDRFDGMRILLAHDYYRSAPPAKDAVFRRRARSENEST